MKHTGLRLSMGIASVCLFGVFTCSRAAVAQESERQLTKTKREQGNARERLKAQGVPEANIRAAQKAFQPHPKPSPHPGTLGPPPKGRTPSAKISLTNRPRVFKDLDESGNKPLPSNRSTRQQALDNQKRGEENTEGKHALTGTVTEKQETHHTHHLHHHNRPVDACDNAGSPSDVQNCKKARDELRRPTQKK